MPETRMAVAERIAAHRTSCREVDRACDGGRLLLGLSTAEYDLEARKRILPNGEHAGRDAMWARADAQSHREHAAAIRALPLQTGSAGHE